MIANDRELGLAVVRRSRPAVRVGGHRARGTAASDEPGICRPNPVPARRRLRPRPRSGGTARDRRADRSPDAAHRAARPAHARALRRVVVRVPVHIGGDIGGSVPVRGGLFPLRPGRTSRIALPAIPLVSRQHGLRAAGRRCLRVHGGMGDHGALVVLPGDHAAPHRGDPPRRLPVSADGAPRRHRDPIVLRRASGGQLAVQLRCDAQRATFAAAGGGGTAACAGWIRRQGGAGTAARMAA